MPDWRQHVRFNLKLPDLHGSREAEIVDEIAQQLDEAYRDALADGLSEEEASKHSCQQIPDWTKLSKEISAREVGAMSRLERWETATPRNDSASVFEASIDGFRRDLFFAIRTLVRKPGFAILAICAIGLGIAATVTSFSVLQAAFLRPLPYPQAQDLVVITGLNQKENVTAGAVSAADFYDWRAQSECFLSMAAYSNWAFNLTGTIEPERIESALVSPEFFTTLQVQPLQGRTFRSDEDENGKSDVVIVSAGLWARIYGDSQLRDQAVTLNGTRMKVVGVVPNDFAFPTKEVEAWVPLALSPADRQNRSGRWLSVIARLKPDMTLMQAQQNIDVLSRHLAQAYPESNLGWVGQVISLHEKMFGSLRKPLLLLQSAVFFLFLTGCLNVAGLMLARAKAREAEISTRFVLGASRLGMVRQFLCESLVFSAGGGAVGVFLAYCIVRFTGAELTRIVPVLVRIAISSSSIVVGVSLTAVSMLICGLLPAIHAARHRGPIESHRAPNRVLRMRQVLVVGQVAFSVMLAAGAMVSVRSFLKLSTINPGFNPHNVFTADLTFPKSKYGTTPKQMAFLRDLIDRVRHVPGVTASGMVSDPPLRENSMSFHVMREQDRDLPANRLPQAGVRWVTAGYFSAMQIPLLVGRVVDSQDLAATPLSAVVNRSMWTQMWPSGNPIGQRIRVADDPRWFSVVGVVDDVKQLALHRDEVPALYLPYEQKSEEWLNWGTLVIRSTISPEELVRTVRSQIHDLDPDQPISKTATVEQYIDDEIAIPRFVSAISSGFSWLALILALLGVSTVVAFVVSQRTHEIGVRVALGAHPFNVLRLVMRDAVLSAAIGLAIGVAASIALVQVMQTVLYGVEGTEASILVAVGVSVVLLTLVACYIPASKALLIDPIRALRYE